MQHETQRPVQFEITSATREAVQKRTKQAGLKSEDSMRRTHALWGERFKWVVASSQLLSLFLRFRLGWPADPSSIGMNMFGVSILRRGFGPRAGG